MNQKITIACAFAVCFIAAFIAARALSERDSAPQPGSANGAAHKAGDNPQADDEMKPATPPAQPRDKVPEMGHAMANRPLIRMKAILENPSPVLRMEEWTEFITSLDSSQIQEVIEEYPVRDAGEPYVHECQALYKIWGKKDPQAAMRQANQEDFFFRIIALMAVTESWAADDPEAASAWLDKQDQDELSDRYRRKLTSIIEKNRQ